LLGRITMLLKRCHSRDYTVFSLQRRQLPRPVVIQGQQKTLEHPRRLPEFPPVCRVPSLMPIQPYITGSINFTWDNTKVESGTITDTANLVA